MGPTSMVHAGEAGLTSVVEGMAKVREALPDSIREAADRKLGADSTLGKGVLAMVDTVAEESAKAKATKAALAVEAAAASTAVAAAAEEKALALVEAADSAAKESRGRGGKVLLGGLALGAAAAGPTSCGGVASRLPSSPCRGRRSGLPPAVEPSRTSARRCRPQPRRSPSRCPTPPLMPSRRLPDSASDVADQASDAAADAGDAAKSFNDQIDEVADSMATDVVDAIETPEGGVKGI